MYAYSSRSVSEMAAHGEVYDIVPIANVESMHIPSTYLTRTIGKRVMGELK